MYDSFYKSFTDYNNDEANTDKFITKFEVTLSDLSVLDTLYWQYVDESTIPTTTTTSLLQLLQPQLPLLLCHLLHLLHHLHQIKSYRL